MFKSLNVENFVPEAAITSRQRTKPGGRVEADLDLAHPAVRALEHQLREAFPDIGSRSLRFASRMVARPSDADDQDFHADSKDADQVNALMYLTDVPKALYGAFDLAGQGPILGPAGTTVLYKASDLHRGIANTSDQDRVALAFAFADDRRNIATIGAVPPLSGGAWALMAILVAVLFLIVMVRF